jgi:hypothetical protein
VGELSDLAVEYARSPDGPARDAAREKLRAAIALEPYPLGGPHSILWHQAPMRCDVCGHDTGSCDCSPDTLRCWKCLDCGFRVMTGGRSIGELLDPPKVPS